MSLAHLIINSDEDVAIDAVLAGAAPDELDEYGMRPLIQAVITQKINLISVLLANGANIEQKDSLGKTALQWAVSRYELQITKFLLDKGANPNHYSADGQPILVNPILRGQHDLLDMLLEYGACKNFAQDFISAKLIGHRFELTGEIDIRAPNDKFIPLSFEGFYLEFTCGLIYSSLRSFINSIPGQRFAKYSNLCDKILYAIEQANYLMDFHKHLDKDPFKDKIDKILQNDLLLLPVAHQGHAVSFVKYKNLLARCDRGVKHIVDTVVIFEIGNPHVLTNKYYRHILYGRRAENFTTDDIKADLKLKPLKTLPTKSQISGNCSWANIEASVPAMLFLLLYEDRESLRLTSQHKRSVMAFYNSWVEWDKDSSLDEAIEDIQDLDTKRALSKAVMLGSVLIQRCHFKIQKEVERAKKILTVLIEPAYQFILKSYKRIYGRKIAGKIGVDFFALLKESGLDAKNFKFNKRARRVKQKNNKQDVIKMTTALHIAAIRNDLPEVKYLIEKLNLDINYLDRTGSTALMYAAWQGFELIVDYLLANGADKYIVNYKGGTAKRYASYAGHYVIATKLS